MVTLEQLQAGLVLPIDKPRQWTSFQAVNKIKAVVRNTYGLKKFKIGHAGTLDPLATGLLLVCLGKATKLIPRLQDGDKVYTGTFVLGATTPCFDLEQAIDRYYPYEHITPARLREEAARLTGTIMQVPPMFSAVKVDGQRAYEYARRDDPSVTIQPKPVQVYSFEITDFRPASPPAPLRLERGADTPCIPPPSPIAEGTGVRPHLYDHPQGEVPPHLPQADFRISCGKGTYIRSLARDLGEALGSGAFLSALRREQIGSYTVDQALRLDEVHNHLTA
ncbi:MAG: tRNA pseudouridine(55) synthase TruB [Bacteroidales bacterium]|nr:tRNA pseudouridine(55) synthase TruB [Bacteroidales bacterium]